MVSGFGNRYIYVFAIMQVWAYIEHLTCCEYRDGRREYHRHTYSD